MKPKPIPEEPTQDEITRVRKWQSYLNNKKRAENMTEETREKLRLNLKNNVRPRIGQKKA